MDLSCVKLECEKFESEGKRSIAKSHRFLGIPVNGQVYLQGMKASVERRKLVNSTVTI